MDASWIVWVLSALVFLGAIRVLTYMPGAADFRKVACILGILALTVSVAREDLRWHLIWFTPVAIIAAYFYALRRMLALFHRIKKITKSGISDPEQIRRALQGNVDDYNRNAPEDQKLR